MALRVNYKNRIGYYTKTERFEGEPDRKFKNWMCHANVDLWADMYFYTLDQDSRNVLEMLRDWAEEFETWWMSHDEDWMDSHDYVVEIWEFTDKKAKAYIKTFEE